MAHRIACWFLVIATLLGVPAAFAQTGVAKFRAACGQDFQRFCTGVQPGGGRIINCWPVVARCQHRADLSWLRARKVAVELRRQAASKIRAVRMLKGFAPGCLWERTVSSSA